MKGMQGVIIALALAIVGAVCNWFYIDQKARELTKVSFIAIAEDANVQVGTKFKDDHFIEVKIPERNLGNIHVIGVPWSQVAAVRGYRAPRSYDPGELLLAKDLKQPPQEPISESLAMGEELRWVTVDPNGFNASLINPHDMVTFYITVPTGGTPNPAAGGARPSLQGSIERVGPFEVLSLGNRRGRQEVLKAKGVAAGRENQIGIRVEFKNGKMLDSYKRLFDLLALSPNSGVQVALLSDKLKRG